MSGSGPGRRAVLRWAWRMFRREWRQQALLLAMVTVAVAVAVAGASMAVNAASKAEDQFGNAGGMVHLQPRDAASATATVAAARQRFGTVEVIGHSAVAVPGSALPLDVRAQDPAGVFGSPLLALRSGRYPERAGEVALTDGPADLLAARVGDRVVLGRVERTVVGRVENPGDLNDEFALVPAAEAATADSLTLLINPDDRAGPVADGAGGSSGINFGIMVAPDDEKVVVALVLVATTLAMALVGLVAAAGFVVVAQRRQRQLGLLAAIGATSRHLRLVMLANGAIVGAVAALVGAAIGIAGWVVATPAVETAAAHRIDRLDVPWALIAECLAIAVLACTAAAWWPARTMARLPVMSALSGRPARPSPVHRSLGVALVLGAAGAGAIVAARPTSDRARPLVLIAGVLAMVAGVVFASPAAIRVLRVPAGRLPFAARLALRDLVRYQARAAAALAAITLVLGISVATVVVAKAGEYRGDEGNLSNHQLVVRVGDPRTAPDPNLSQAERARLDAAAATVTAVIGRATVFTLDAAMRPTVAGDARDREPISVVMPVDQGFRWRAFPAIATPELLRRYGIDPATIASDTELLTSLDGDVMLLDIGTRPDPATARSLVQRVDLPTYSAAPNSLVTEEAMGRHGWVAARAGWLVESPSPLTKDQVAKARAAAAAGGLTVETRSGQDGLATLRTVATGVGGLLALAIVAMTIGLIRSEGVRDMRTLTATGASAGARRTVTAGTAGALAVLGVVLSTAAAYAALLAAYHADLSELARPPVGHLAALALGLPALATGAAWLLAGREPATFARQALD